MQFDEIIVRLGEFGSYQKRVYFLLCYPFFVCAFPKLMWVFVAANLPHRCKLPEDDNSTTFNLPLEILNRSIPWDYTRDTWDNCHKYSLYTFVDGNSTRNVSQKIPCSEWVYDRSQYSTSAVSDFNLVCNGQWFIPLTVSLQMGGEFIGSILLGVLSDRFGRKIILVISSVMQTLVGIITSLSSGITMLIICRLLIGFWTPGVVFSSYVISLEFVGPGKRVFAGIMTQNFFAMGYLLIAVTAYFIRNWRYLQIALSIPSIIIFTYWWLVPESVRWLIIQNKKDEAMKIIKKIAAANKISLSEDVINALNQTEEQQKPKQGTLGDLMRYPNLRKRTLIVVYCWFVNSCVYYGFSFNTSNLAGNDYINFGLAAGVEFPAYAVCFFAVEKIGRKIPLYTSMILSGIALFISSLVPSDNVVIVIALAMFGKFAITISYAVLYMYSAEVFPTTIRSASYGLSSTFGRIGAMLAPFMLMFKMYWTPLPSVLFSIFAITSGLLCYMLPETHGRELPETIQDGECFMNSKVKRSYAEEVRMDSSKNSNLTLLQTSQQDTRSNKYVA